MSDGTDSRARPIVLTFDNLGEASALQRGTWDPRTPLGSDPSVTLALPWLLDALDDSGLRATFFVEAINCELNPDALRSIAARGHELGVHGWEHEVWGELDGETERELLQRATRAFAALGLGARGFRPPGGDLTDQTPALLGELGFDWCSPAKDSPGAGALAGGGPDGSKLAGDGLAMVPFDWELVDAYHLMVRFADLRASRGDARAALSADAAGERMAARLRDAADPRTVILHPFLMLDPAWRDQVQRLLERMAAQGAVMPGGAFARSRVGR
ncbi:MAG TPA: polysaccharide deacetylase family protein [Solirubrobacteraceae bacterium]|jgi:peptidoglycan/xylan/chitin deacetylase (PgdA/CDA1 family)|nr:polysaccharide deacetylase family protein [Solirubrobacteraceae bacterium]